MAAFCRFWRIAPSEYWALSADELAAMTDFATDEIEARERERRKSARKASRVRRRH